MIRGYCKNAAKPLYGGDFIIYQKPHPLVTLCIQFVTPPSPSLVTSFSNGPLRLGVVLEYVGKGRVRRCVLRAFENQKSDAFLKIEKKKDYSNVGTGTKGFQRVYECWAPVL